VRLTRGEWKAAMVGWFAGVATAMGCGVVGFLLARC